MVLVTMGMGLASGSAEIWVKAIGEFHAWLVHPEHVFEVEFNAFVYPSVPEHKRVSRYEESGCESV